MGCGWGGAAAAPERVLVQDLMESPAPSLDTPSSLGRFPKDKTQECVTLPVGSLVRS